MKSPSEFALERKIVMMVNAISSEQVGCYGGSVALKDSTMLFFVIKTLLLYL